MRLASRISLICLVVLVACGSGENKEIGALLSQRENAFETKDAELYMTLIEPGYSEQKDDKTIGLEEIRKNFLTNVSLFDNLKITHSNRSIYMKGNEADVFQITLVEADINDSKSAFKLSEKLRVKKFGDKWLIVKESGADYFEGYVFGGQN